MGMLTDRPDMTSAVYRGRKASTQTNKQYSVKKKDSVTLIHSHLSTSKRRGRASDSGARGRGFDPHSGRRVVSLSKIHLPPKTYR